MKSVQGCLAYEKCSRWLGFSQERFQCRPSWHPAGCRSIALCCGFTALISISRTLPFPASLPFCTNMSVPKNSGRFTRTELHGPPFLPCKLVALFQTFTTAFLIYLVCGGPTALLGSRCDPSPEDNILCVLC
jgi:hypothetical protein